MQISIQQSVINGFMGSLRPTVSFSAILPNGSEVFRKVKNGDLDGLRQMLAEGTASLSDCNERGNSLLTVCPSYWDILVIFSFQDMAKQFKKTIVCLPKYEA